MQTYKLLRLLLVFGLLTSTGLAQHITGTIVGTVKDASGGVIPTAAVTVTNEDTNVDFVAATQATGNYVASNLLPGTYTITTVSAGFKKNTVKGIRLLANRTVRVDVVLEIGTLVETVEVRAPAPVVNTENATVGSVMESGAVSTLPLNGRTIDRLVLLVAGVVSASTGNPRLGGTPWRGGTEFNVDGANFTDTGNARGLQNARTGMSNFPSIDSISEFKADSSNMKAEYEGAAAVSVVTKSGSNDFHGSLFWFNRNKAYAARAHGVPASQPKPPFIRNEFGGTFGGPIRKGKTFFFADYEGLRQRLFQTNRLSVATAAMRNGDFSGLPVIRDPLSGQPFPNNRIPESRIDSRSKTLIGWVPLPNVPGTGPAGTLNNWIGDTGTPQDVNRTGARLDHRLSERDSLWGRFNYSRHWPFIIAQSSPPNYGNGASATTTTSVYATHVHTFSPNTLNEFRFAYLHHFFRGPGQNKDFDPRTIFPGLYPVPEGSGGLPSIDISSHVGIFDRNGDVIYQDTYQFIDNFTLVRGRHTLKTGINIERFLIDNVPTVFAAAGEPALGAGRGRFTFNGRYTNINPSATAQPAHAFADFLLGYPVSTARAQPTPHTIIISNRFSAYFQDDWQVSPRLTLNLGLRYVVQTPWREREGNQSSFDFASNQVVVAGRAMPPLAVQRIVDAFHIVTSAEAGLGDELVETDKVNFGPRLGFAFRPFGGNKTVIRGGAGIFYTFQSGFTANLLSLSTPPFVLVESFEAAAGQSPSLTLANPFPGTGTIPGSPAVNAFAREMPIPTSRQWNLSVERELFGNFSVRASYVGNNTSEWWFSRPANEPRQAPGAIQPRRPYQPWANISLVTPGAHSTFNQLQLEAIKRYSSGVFFQAEYSWNRALGNAPITGGPQDPYDNRSNKGNTEGIFRHILTMYGSYDLPFGPGKRFASAQGAFGKIVGGWQVAGISRLTTGSPLSVTFSATQAGWVSSRANLLRDPRLPRSERSVGRWFDVSAFAVPAPFTYGNSSRNLLFGPGVIDVDLSVLKNTRVGERYTVQFRAEFFNVANHANLGNPATNISVAANVGRITTRSGSRVIQFGLKVLF